MTEPVATVFGVALTYLRSKFRWTKRRLAQAAGMKDDLPLTRYERGVRELSRPMLISLLSHLPLEDPEGAADVLVFTHELVFPETPEEPASPIALTAEERRSINRAAMAVGLAAAKAIRADLTRRKRAEKTEAARREAEALWARLRKVPQQDRRDLVAILPALQTVPLAAQICEASVRAAADDAGKALELAQLAVFIAERVPGEESLRSRAQGYCWAYVANARRVAEDFDGADEAFSLTWHLWRAGAQSVCEILQEWRLLSLEASLRRAEQRFPRALELLELARAASEENPLAVSRILLKKEHVSSVMGDIEGALVALAEAVPFVEAARDRDLLFALRFNMADDLFRLERYAEATELLPCVRELALERCNELDFIRVLWLQSKLKAGQGQVEEGVAGLEQVRQDFLDRDRPYDAALASLDLAVLWLQTERTTEVRGLAVEMEAIFKAKKIHREALAALSLFCESAKRECATVELAKRAIMVIERLRSSSLPRN